MRGEQRDDAADKVLEPREALHVEIPNRPPRHPQRPQANELERRQALAAMIRGDVHQAAGHVTRGEGGAATLPSWL